MNTTPLITLDSIECRFRTRQGMFRSKTYTALSDLSLDILLGETLGIIGRNGSGKSTLLKVIAGIFRPESGRIVRHKNLSVSLLSLHAGFDPELPGTMNAVLSAMLLGFSKDQALEKLDRIVHFAELENWINEPVKTYSTGMKARLGFAVVIEMSPDILLIDEVLGVGDRQFQTKSKKAMKKKILSDQTIVLVSHAIGDVKELCSRVAWIEHGRLQMVGDPDKVIQAYEHTLQ